MTPWRYRRGTIWRWRNALGDSILQMAARPIIREINARRVRHGLSEMAVRIPDDVGLAQIAQQPAFFDYPRERLPDNFHYNGPWHSIEFGQKLDFPWEKLDGRPLVYASMGTLQNRQSPIFEAIATACAGLDAQLVLSLGSHHQRLELKLAGSAIVVPFAPQLELLRRATLTITHAGLNTALESLAQGVPMVAIPITNDQPGVASRLKWLGVAKVVPPERLTARRLHASVRSRSQRRALPRQGLAMEGGNPQYRRPPTRWRYRRTCHHDQATGAAAVSPLQFAEFEDTLN